MDFISPRENARQRAARIKRPVIDLVNNNFRQAQRSSTCGQCFLRIIARKDWIAKDYTSGDWVHAHHFNEVSARSA